MNKFFMVCMALFMAGAYMLWSWQRPTIPKTAEPQSWIAEVKGQSASQQLSSTQREKVVKVLENSDSEQIPVEVLNQLPLSLRGAPLPAALAVHDDGTLVIAFAVRQYFDYFLTAIGEEPLTLIVARVKHQLTSQLQEPALSQALVIFGNYITYRDELAKLLGELEQQQDYQILRAQIKASRDSHFDAQVIESFFADEDSYDEYMHARSLLGQDDNLTPEQKRQQAQQLLLSAPQWLQAQHHKANQLNDFHQAQAKLQVSGAEEDEIQALREQTFGADAADRLAVLAQKRQVWQQKLQGYHAKLQELLDASLDGQVLQDEVNQLRLSYFSENELLRVQAIDENKFGRW